jgi:hypothetical protein
MKAIVATATVIVSLLGARLVAADATRTTIPVEQQFQQADVQLAIEQYKKLRMAAFDLELKLQTETIQSDDQRKHLQVMRAQLQERAADLRAEMIKAATVAVANTR